MIKLRENEIISKLIENDSKAEAVYAEVCKMYHTEEFARKVYRYNLKNRPCDLDMGSGIDDKNYFLEKLRDLDAECPYDDGE